MRQRSVAWDKDDDAGAEFVEVALDADALSAGGVAVGGEPAAYRLDYTLETGPGFVTARLRVTARGEGWRRTLDLRRAESGHWTASTTTEGDPPAALDPPGPEAGDAAPGGPRAQAGGAAPGEPDVGVGGAAAGDAAAGDAAAGDAAAGGGGAGASLALARLPRLEGALDCDLGLSPLTNSMPVLRHRLLETDGSVEFLMAWVSVPDLGAHPSRQRYTALRDLPGGGRLIRYESLDSTFTADLGFDRDGLVVDYPGIGRRLG
jgi:uncharacterized protein